MLWHEYLPHVGAGDESYADAGGHKALEQFAGIEFHGKVGFQLVVIEQRIERVARVAEFRYDQWIGSDLGHGDALLGREGCCGDAITTSSSR